MSFRRIVSIVIVSGFLLAVCIAALWEQGGTRLFAQDDTAADTLQIYLPFVVSDSATSTDDERQIDPSPITQDGHTHDHTTPLLDSWPPQLVGIGEVTWLASNANTAIVAAQQLEDQAETIASASPSVQAALGERYVHSATIYPNGKGSTSVAGKGNSPIRVAYFSYSHNTTVEAEVIAGKVASVQTMQASTYQPEPTRRERTDAIKLAREYFVRQGETRVTELRGFVIMAYQNQGATGFYDSRVLYVTFHESLEERPEYLAWVDLSRDVILKAETESYEQTEPSAGLVAPEVAEGAAQSEEGR